MEINQLVYESLEHLDTEKLRKLAYGGVMGKSLKTGLLVGSGTGAASLGYNSTKLALKRNYNDNDVKKAGKRLARSTKLGILAGTAGSLLYHTRLRNKAKKELEKRLRDNNSD